jgi:N-dimethylarginine dimethylaminohydrolase
MAAQDVAVTGSGMTRHILMCEPAHYNIAYEINPWMHRANAVNGPPGPRAVPALHTLLAQLEVRVELVQQGDALPDMTFTASAGVVLGRRFIPANFRFPERQPEAELFTRWFEDAGYETVPIHAPHYWEGEGDVLDTGDTVLAGYRFRTEFRALDHLDEIRGRLTVRLKLADPRFYHLDTCLCPLGGGRPTLTHWEPGSRCAVVTLPWPLRPEN